MAFDNAFYERNTLELPNPLHKLRLLQRAVHPVKRDRGIDQRQERYLRNPRSHRCDSQEQWNRARWRQRSSFRTNERNKFNVRAVNREGPSIRTDMRLAELRQDYGKYTDSIKILHYNHDLFIENVNMLSTISPNAERNMSNFTKMEFEIHEPFGITFHREGQGRHFPRGLR